MENTAAILLRRTRFSETSLILTWLTLEHGKLKTMAKGALRPKSAFAGVVDLFYETEIAFVRSSRSEIQTLREVVLRNPFDGLRRDYMRVELAAYFVELLEVTTELEHPIPELYDLLRRALTHFESELARLMGVHNEGNAYAALSRVCHHLPDSRRGLIAKLA